MKKSLSEEINQIRGLMLLLNEEQYAPTPEMFEWYREATKGWNRMDELYRSSRSDKLFDDFATYFRDKIGKLPSRIQYNLFYNLFK